MDLYIEDIVALAGVLLCCKLQFMISKRKEKRIRRYKTRPLNRQRASMGQYANLVKFMQLHDHDQFFKYTRLTVEQYEALLKLVAPHIQKAKNRQPLSPGHRLTMTLHFLSQGSSMQEIAWSYHVGKTTVHCIIRETCKVLWDILSPLYLPPPSVDSWHKIMSGFYKRWNMPNCIGALDGKHIRIQAPKHSGTEFFSYKKDFSLILMATCDAYYCFNLVDIGGAGSSHDSSVFRESLFGKGILKNLTYLHLPQDKTLPLTDIELPCFLVADQAFPLSSRIMRPYPGENLCHSKRIFNYRLSRARRVIENTFGILVQRWRILRKPILGDIVTCESIVKAAVVLHNFVQKSEENLPFAQRRYCPTGFVDYYDENGELQMGNWRTEKFQLESVHTVGSNNSAKSIQSIRDTLAAYFISDQGTVSWQNEQINVGKTP